MIADTVRRHLARDPRVVLRIERNHRQVDNDAFVAGAGVRDLPQRHRTTSIATAGRTSERGISVVPIASTSRAVVVTPPPPAGPFVYSASTSLPIRRASRIERVRPATRSLTSYGSAVRREAAP